MMNRGIALMKNRQKTGYLMVLTAGILWGTIGFFVTILKNMGAEPGTVSFMRIASAAVILIPALLAVGGVGMFKIDRKGLLWCLMLGIFCQALFNYSYTESINHVGVAAGAVLLYTSPVFVCIMSRMFFKEHINRIKLIALAVNIVGCVLTVTGGDFTSVHFSVTGVLFGVAAGFLYGLMTIISTAAMKDYNPLTVIFYSFLFGAIVLAIITRPFDNIGSVASLKFFAAAIGYGLIPTVGSYFFYMHGLSRGLETSKVPVVASVETIVAALIGLVVFSEAGGLFKLVGIACVVSSIAIMNLSKPASKPTDFPDTRI